MTVPPGTRPTRPTASSGAALDDEVVAAEVAAVFARYERALREADVATLTELFWDDARCVRYGVADRQQGAAEIAAWRAEHPGVPPGRRLSGTVVLPIGPDAAVVSTLFTYPGSGAEGRQTQTWARTRAGWRIVAAHVSEIPGH
ncbi:AtzH-like domain-containing protein [Actinomycetospora sp. NBRC 106378]|uniref:AtzH-like domain-containing protein n=1 Tax=Actinomycetospora sp. NBRC 106378 TaxID=3032208 RepID=UPI0025565C64|nr:AtzH-like domain-containing protein [Actinomycetospora sp. NBRC 106378]